MPGDEVVAVGDDPVTSTMSLLDVASLLRYAPPLPSALAAVGDSAHVSEAELNSCLGS